MVGTNFSLLQSVFSRSAFISEADAEMFMPYVQALESGKLENFPKDFMAVAMLEGEDYFNLSSQYSNYPRLVDGVMLIPIQGPLMRADYCFSAGTETIAKWYQQGAADPKVLGFVENQNCPGGAVDGIHELATLKTTIQKPVITLNNSVCASGGYYTALGSNSGIYATTRMGRVGSIGAMGGYRRSKQETTVDVYADTSPKKNHISRELQKGNQRPYIEFVLNPPDADFMSFAKQRRPQLSQDALDGMDYYNSEAEAQGLIDGFMTLPEAIQKVKTISNQTKQKNKMTGLIAAISSLFPTAKAATDEETAVNTVVQVKDLQAKAITLEKEKTDALAAMAAEKEAHIATQATLTALQATATQKDTKIAELQAKIAQTPAVQASVARNDGNNQMGDSGNDETDPNLASALAKQQALLDELGL